MKRRSSSPSAVGERPATRPRTLNNHTSRALNHQNMSSNGGPRRLVIKKFKVKPAIPTNYEDTTWEKLKEAICAIQSRKPVSISLEELYRDVENLCYHGMEQRLYSRLEAVCATHAASQKHRVVGQTGDVLVFLGLVESTWKDHCEHMVLIRSVFLYLDRTHVLQTPGLHSLWDMGLNLFREHVVSDTEVLHKTVAGIMEMIGSERDGEAVDRSLVQSLTHMLSDLRLYSEAFETPFLQATTDHYLAQGNKYMGTMEVPDYLKYVQERLKDEQDRATQYLEAGTRRSVLSCVEKQLIVRHVSTIIGRGFARLCDEARHDDLARMYSLFGRVNEHAQLRTAFGHYVKGKGKSIVNDEEKDKTMVGDLLTFKQSVDGLVESAFGNNESFIHTLKESFEAFINARQNKPAELIAKHVDVLLRTGNKTSTDDMLDVEMDRAMTLFRFITGKDVFEAFYKKDLAKRLLLARSASYDAERQMLSKLKIECGAGFTTKLEGMFHDMRLSTDIMDKYRETHVRQSIELNVNVLTQGYWPAYTACDSVIPDKLATLADAFRSFYLSKHTGRKLTWIHSLGHCTVRANFPNGKKELQVSLYQALVLVLFNDVDVLSFSDIMEATRIKESELRRTLQSLACGRHHVLRKAPRGRDVNDGDTFTYNKGFKAQLIRIKVNQIQLRETLEERHATEERVFQDRQYQVDAAIVRIMKSRKIYNHQLLISDVYSQLKFDIPTNDIKKRIESLMERDYLERDTKDSTLYHYLA